MSDAGYQVLARKYRPQRLSDLVGQDAMVRTLRNAFEHGRVAQAFILTGIRGTGKTSTARIIAKGMNCIGPDGTGGPTTEPCGVCEPCIAIAEGRHVDVLEMDAASRTGVGDIREIIESVRYRAASARYKIYIIDEVHMLSASAFNALLKTLEEPPEHVKFIFATTEIRKVPVTVLSRCQRFDLRRIEPETMIAMLARIAEAEGAAIEDGALALIARAAEGSARDAQSLLDQAIAQGGGGPIGADAVREMLGLADRGRVLDLFEKVMDGDAAGALGELGAQYAEGADPLAILRDLAEVTHWLSVVKLSPEAAEDPTLSPDERLRGADFAARLPIRVLSRAWQMLLKGIEETSAAPNGLMAAEMVVIRLTHVADLPTPEELVRKLQETPPAALAPPPAGGGAGQGHGHGGGGAGGSSQRAPEARGGGAAAAPRLAERPAPAAAPEGPVAALAALPDFPAVVELIRTQRDMRLLLEVEEGVRLVAYTPGRIEFEPAPGAPPDLAQRLARRLGEWTQARWGVSVTGAGGAPSIAETRAASEASEAAAALAEPLVQAVLAAFPGAEVTPVRTAAESREAAEVEALDVPDEWDPLEG